MQELSSRWLSRHLVALGAAALLSLTIAPAAFAQAADKAAQAAPASAKPDAKTGAAAGAALEDGRKAFEGGDFNAALDKFKSSDSLVESAEAKLWVARSLDKLEKVGEAIAAYESFLAHPDASKVGEEQVATAKKRVEELQAGVPGKLNISTDPAGAKVTINGDVQEGTSPMLKELPAGLYQVDVALEGYQPKQLQVEVKPREQTNQTIELELVAEPAAPPPAAPPPATPPPAAPAQPEPSKVPAYVTLGVSGAALITGTIFGIKALGQKSDFNDDPTTKRADDLERTALVTDMAFAIAITLGVTGVVLLTSDAPPAETAPTAKAPGRLSVAPYVGRQRGGAVASYTF